MSRNERFLAQLAALAREYGAKLRPGELVQSRLRWEDWETLRPEALAFANEEIRRRKWRGNRGGVLPEGYDAEAVANQAIAEIMEGKCRLVMGFTRERVVKELKRLVGQKVRVLHRLKEAGAVRSEWEGEHDGSKSLLEDVLAEGESVDEAVSREEEEGWRGRVVKGFEEFLGSERELVSIFGCLRAGVKESRGIARELGMDVAAVVKGRKRLVRRAGKYKG